jgi:methylamine dehydrogenase accessory protein MauD
MIEALVVSNLIVWVTLLLLIVALLALARQVGILFERVAPMGALMMDQGPRVGEVAPQYDLEALAGGRVGIGGRRPKSQLVFWLSPTCPVCKKLLPVLKSIREEERDWMDIVLASDGEHPQHVEFYRKTDLRDFPYVLSHPMGMAYRISKLPYAVLIGEDGVVRAKGLVNSREQLESLFLAKESGVASIQDFLSQQA